jgi:hypothetical protein
VSSRTADVVRFSAPAAIEPIDFPEGPLAAGQVIRSKISRIHVGDRGDHRGAGKPQHGKRAAPPVEKHFSASANRAFGE